MSALRASFAGLRARQAAMRRLPRLTTLVAAALAALGAVPAAMPAAAQAQRPEILVRAPLDPGAGVNFHALATPDTVWVGEQVNYQVGVFMDEDVRSRLRRNPEFMPPELRAMLAYDLPTHQSFVPKPGSPGARLEAYVFRRALFPLQPGRYEIPAATLAYSLPLSRSFFSREESFTKRTKPVTVFVRALPDDGRPADFDGAVGRLAVETVVDTVPARVGDPLRLTIRVRGEGNINLLPRPRLALPWATVTPTRERVRIDAGAATVSGAKEFDWLVTPRDDGAQVVPVIRYPFFDPDDARYRVVVSQPVAVTVLPGTLAAAPDDSASGETPRPPIRTAWRGALPRPPAEHDGFWLLALLAPLPAVGVVAARSWRRGERRAAGPHEALRALAGEGRPGRPTPAPAAAPAGDAGDPVARARQARRLAMLAIARRLDVPPLPFVGRGELAWILRRAGVSTETARETEQVLQALDRVAYGRGEPADRDAATVTALVRRASAAVTAVDAEASRRRSLARRALAARRGIGLCAVVAAGLALGAYVGAQPTVSPEAIFADGVRAYDAGDESRARDAFHAAARAEPRAADAWANYGTASWVVGDTAGAVVGWQRALRLEPRAADLRPRLAYVPGAAASPHASVPAVPPAPLQYLALGAWLVAALTLAVALQRRHSALVTAAGVALGVALLAGGAAAWVHDRVDASQLAVISEGGSTRAAPALGSEPGASVVAGEVVRVEHREGVWSRVDLDRGTTGWLESARLLPLGD